MDTPHANHAQGAGTALGPLLDWFSGNGAYHNLVHCMGHDYLWIGITITLDVAVAAGYLLIAKHWWNNERTLPDIPARRALASMRNIFLFCGICGYLFIPVKMIWPAWRLYDMVMLALVYFTWRYAWSATNLKVIYAELGKGTKLAEELEATKEQSERKTFFLNAVSHDLRTPLNGLVLQASLAGVSAETGDHEGLKQALATMKASARTAGELLDSLLDYARMEMATETPHTDRVGLAQLIRQVCDANQPAAAAAKLTLRARCPEDLVLLTDRAKLERILGNLIGNALKFTPTGGVRVEVVSTKSAVEIHVIDTGIGITMTDRAKLFDEFFQVSNHERDRRKGFGLGLAIARRLARQLGGDITVDSAPGQGSRFSLALPGVCDVGAAGDAAEPERAAIITAAE
ncbi:sensor histidine kinase [Humisphaera borealis]|uniref:histidine kinase n=1 Tax=Humisphaera borealis TaxID=2807512 RepID=A0A7M2WUB9_9BACT|nr:HAMP domain-containing sensor histidine kinase [Humisphaera borealis]QOV89117.1 HAMP domain-containing histidine kinase [Humisphaera borealis]